MAGMINTDETFCLYMDDIVKTEETVKDEPMEQIGDDFENAIWNCLENTNGCSEDDILKAVCRSPLMVMLPAFAEGDAGPPETLTSLEQDLFAVVDGENAGSTLPLQMKKELPHPVIEQVHGVELDDRGSPKVLMEVGRIEPPSTTPAMQVPAVAPNTSSGEGGGGDDGSASNVDRPGVPPVLHVAIRTPGVDKSFHCSCGKVYRHSGSLSKHIRVLRNRLTMATTQPSQSGCGSGSTLNTAVTQASENIKENSTTNTNVNHNTIDMQRSELNVTSSPKEISSGQNFAFNGGFQGGNSINDGNPSSSMQTNVTAGHCNSLSAISPPSQVEANRNANMNVQCNVTDLQHSRLEVATPQMNKDSSGQNYALNSVSFQGNNKIMENGNPISNVQSNKVVGLSNSLSSAPHSSQVQTVRTTDMAVQGNVTDMQFGQLKIATPQPIKPSNGHTFAHDPRGFQASNSTINNGNPIINVQSIKTENHDSSFAAVPPLSHFNSLLSTIHLGNSTERNGMRNTSVGSNMNIGQYNSPVTTPYVIHANTGQVAHTSPVQSGIRNTTLDHNIIVSQYSSLAANPHVNHYSSAHMSTPIPAVQDTNNTGQNGMRSPNMIGSNMADTHYTKLVPVPHASQVSNGHVSALTNAVQVNAGQNAMRNSNVNCNQIVGQYNSVAAIPHMSQITANGFSGLNDNSSGQNGMSNANVENNMTGNRYSSVVAAPLGGQTVSGGYGSAPSNVALNSYSTVQNGMGNAYIGSNLTDRHYNPHVDSSSVSQANRGHVNMLLTGVQGSNSTAQTGMTNVTDRQYTTLETVPHVSPASSGLMNVLASTVRDTNSCVQNGTRLSNVESNVTGRHYTTLPMNQVSGGHVSTGANAVQGSNSSGHVSTGANAVQGSNSSGQNDIKKPNLENNVTNKHYTMLESVPHASQNNSRYINTLPPNVQNSSGTNQNRMRIVKVENTMTVGQYSSVASQADRAPMNIVQASNSARGNDMKNAPPVVGRQIKQEWQPPENTGVAGKCSIEKVGACTGVVRGTANVPVNNQVVRNNNQVVRNNNQVVRNNNQVARNNNQVVRNNNQVVRNNNQVIRSNNQVVRKTVYDRKLLSSRVPSSLDVFSKNSKLPVSEGGGYNCFCGISFQKLPTLLTHVETHSREEFELYSTQAILNIKDSVPKDNANSCSDATLKCSTCGIWFEDNAQLNLHMESHGKIDGNEQTILNIGEDNFISSSNNNSFRNTKVSVGRSADNPKKGCISNERTYQCAVCDESFGEFTDLMMHLEIHQKNFSDDQEAVISKGWNEARNRCAREMPESHEALNYQCGLCKKRFKKLRYLTSHMRIHTKGTCPQQTKRPSEPMVQGNLNLSASDVANSNDPAKRMKTTQDPFTQQNKLTNNMPSSGSDGIPVKELNLVQNNVHFVNAKNTTRPNHPFRKNISTMERGTSTHPDGCATTGGPLSVRVDAVLPGKSQEVKKTTKENVQNAGSPLSSICVSEDADPSTENKTFTCICGMVFRTSSALAVHTNDHIGRREYFCEICGKLFKQKCILLSHLRYHSYQKEYKCVKCNKSFERHSDFMAHKRLFRVNVSCCMCRKKMTRAVCGPNHVFPFQNKRFLCVDCEGSTVPNNPESSRDKLGRYTRRTNNSSGVADEKIDDKVESEATKSQLSCTICKSVFTDSKSLLVHSHSHLGECAVILERLNTSEIYKRSYSSGKNDGTVKVVPSQPSKGSAQGNEISSGPSKAVGKKSFAWKCRCGGVFQWRSSMKKHLCKYTGHQCVVCRRLFRRFATLRDHMRSHTGRRKYKCTSCSESFSRLRDLEVHEQCHAKDALAGNVEVCEENPQTELQEARKVSEEPSELEENQGLSNNNTPENDNPVNVDLHRSQGPNCNDSLAKEGPSCASFPENPVLDSAEQPTETTCSPSSLEKNTAFECKIEVDCGAEITEIQSNQQCNAEKTTVSDNISSQPCFGQQPASSERARLGEDKLKSVNLQQSFTQRIGTPSKELQPDLSTEDSNSKADSVEDTVGVLSCRSSPPRCHSVPVDYISVQVKQENSFPCEDLQLNPRENENQSGSEQSNDGQSKSLQVGCEFEVESKYNPETMSSDLKLNGSDCVKKEPTHTQATEKQFLNLETGGDSVSHAEVNHETVNCKVISPQNNCTQDAVQRGGDEANKNEDLIVHPNKCSASNVEIKKDGNVVDGFVKKENFFQECKCEPDAQPKSPAECEKEKDLGNNGAILGTRELEKHTLKRAALVDLISDESGDEHQQVNPGSCEPPPKRHCSEKLRSDLCEQSSKTPNSSPKIYQICDSDVEEEKVDHRKSQSDDVMIVEETNKQKNSPQEVYEISDSDEGEEKESNHQCSKAPSDFVDQESTHLHSNEIVKCEEGHNSAHDELNQSSDAETGPFSCDSCMKPFPDSDALQVHKHIWGKVPCNINKWRNTTQNKQTAQTGTTTIGNAGTLKHECTTGEELRPSSAPERIQSPNESLRSCSCSEKTQCCCKSKCQRQEHREKGSGGHVCRACGKSFAQKDFLIDHLHEHIDGRKYRCKYCNKTFQRSVKLAVHKLRCSQRKMSAKKVKPASDDDDVESNKGASFPRSFAVPFVGVQPQTVPMLVSVPVLVSSAMTWGNIVTLR